jgi:patatin-related protein
MSTNSDSTAKPPVDFDQEVRFAVVMYGGASLAIYINGVAQELLRLVRATAPEFGTTKAEGRAHLADEDLRGSERVYRLLGRILRRRGLNLGDNGKPTPDSLKNAPIRTRFVVDILTGTSAGGINSVYLAKALANDQNMDELKHLWITEGDIGVLINDEESYKQLNFTLHDDPGEPWSLLNSRRMYLRLLEALRGMDRKPACPPGQSPLVDELDLFVTATDMQGRILQLRLADDVVSEYRHRNVFQFRYRSERASDTVQNDLHPENNAFLAFAARATSAHQAAFSPVNLSDATRIIQKYPLPPEHMVEDKELRIFYQDYLLQRVEEGAGALADQDQLAKAFSDIWFVDGGTLDNKPFSFVINELPLRHADTFVDRKLLYVEPAPEHQKLIREQKERPRIVQNASAALSSLPRYETIVEDLTRLLERNLLIERLDHIMRGMERDLIDMPPKEPLTRKELLEKLKDREKALEWIKSKGAPWGSYQRLRVAVVTDDLTLLVARAAGFSEESDEFLAIRYLVRHWRDAHYDPRMENNKRSQVEFLIEFDLMWAIRRIRFVLQKVNDLACLDEDAQRIADVARGKQASEGLPSEDGGEVEEFRKAMRDLRDDLNEALVGLRGGRRKLWSRDDTNPARSFIRALEIHSKDLLDLLRKPTDMDRRDEAERLLNAALKKPPEESPHLVTRGDVVEALTEKVKSELKGVIDEARHECSKALRPPEDIDGDGSLPRWNLFLRKTLWYYYINFEDFDQISYPLLYSSGVGEETDIIDVFRVSPEDACSIIDEKHPVNAAGDRAQEGEAGQKVQKLAGTTLANFGAFLERKFRVNDILWGRLDGAERLISVLLQAHPAALRDHITRQAHRAILVEEMMPRDEAVGNTAMESIVWQALDVWDDDRERCVQLLTQAAGMLPNNSKCRAYLEMLAQGADPIQLFKETFIRNYDAGRQFTEDATLKTAKRTNRVLNDMILFYVDSAASWKRKLAMWIGRRLRIFIEAAIEPEGSARRKQKLRLAACYLLSLLILAAVCYPVVVLLLRSSTGLWAVLGCLAILIITLPLALLPLGLTFGYNLLWLKFKVKLASLLQRKGETVAGKSAATVAAKTKKAESAL